MTTNLMNSLRAFVALVLVVLFAGQSLQANVPASQMISTPNVMPFITLEQLDRVVFEAPGTAIDVRAKAIPVELVRAEPVELAQNKVSDAAFETLPVHLRLPDYGQMLAQARPQPETRVPSQIREEVKKIEDDTLEKAREKAGQMEESTDAPRIFKETPTQWTVEENQVDGYTVQTYTRYESFVILPPMNGESELSVSVMRMGIQEAVRGSRAEDFTAEFRAARTRKQQEEVLKKFNRNVAELKTSVSLFDPSTFQCPSDLRTPPTGFPTAPKSVTNPRGYTVIHRFGVNRETRMGAPVTDLASYIRQLPEAEKAIVERLPRHIDFQDRAELADILNRIADTGQLDGLTAREVWTRDYPYRRFSTGAGMPLEFVWFQPDEHGMQERGIVIVSRFSGRVYFANYGCGLNIDEIFGCTAQMVVPSVFSVTGTANFVMCSSIEVIGNYHIDEYGRTQVQPGDRIRMRVIEEATGEKAGKRLANWVWRVGNRQIGKIGDVEVEVTYEDLAANGFLATVESREQAPGETDPEKGKLVKQCQKHFIQLPEAPKIACRSVSVTFDSSSRRVTATVDYEDTANQIDKFVYLVDGRKVGESRQASYSFVAGEREYAPGTKHVVTVQALDARGNVLFTCDGDNATNVFIIPETCPNCVIQGPKQIKETESGTFTFSLDNSRAEWVEYTVSVANVKHNRADLAGDQLSVDGSTHTPGEYRIFLDGKVRMPDGTICSVRCERSFRIKGPGGKWWKWLLLGGLIAGGIIAATQLGGKGQPAPPLDKIDPRGNGNDPGNWRP